MSFVLQRVKHFPHLIELKLGKLLNSLKNVLIFNCHVELKYTAAMSRPQKDYIPG
jgi:hypothetical protein